MTRAIDTKRRVNMAFEFRPGLYQAIAGPMAHRKTYRQFSPDFWSRTVTRGRWATATQRHSE